MAGHVFLSYSRDDSAYVQRLVHHFRLLGVQVWVDQSLVPGTPDWVKAIQQAIEGCTAFVLVMTPYSDKSVWVDREIDLAQELHKPLLPLLLAGRPLLRVRNVQYEDVTGGQMPSDGFMANIQAWLGYSAGIRHRTGRDSICSPGSITGSGRGAST